MMRVCRHASLLVFLLMGCGKDELPSREQIPILHERLFVLERGLRDHNRAAIDSLLSVDILDHKQDSDSLLRYVYRPDHSFAFQKLGDYTIFFNRDLAVIDCFIMDSTSGHDRPLRLTYRLDDDRWLVTQFAEGHPDSTGLL
ncbi:MAG: hypothetical protein AB1772_04690 [Candidatus Zixiibacteriota bacterium]